MKKIGIVLGVAALATFTGCKDADYKGRRSSGPQNEVKTVQPAPAEKPSAVKNVAKPAPAPVKVEEKKCACAPGTKHSSPCMCGASDCKCVVETKPAEPEYTIYVVQSGDYLAKISKKYNVTIAAILKLNPSIKNNVIRVGQKIKLPGKIDVGFQTAPAKSTAPRASAKKLPSPYKGATKEYVVKSGDTLGAIAYGNGINIRQLKQLNNLSSDSLRIGQKLKVPAGGKSVKAKAEAVKPLPKKNEAPAAAPATETAPAEAPAAPVEAPAVEAPAAAETPAPEAPAADNTQAAAESAPAAAPATTTYVVQEGDDMTSVSISWGVSAAAIRELNNLGENDQLKPGQVIKLPADAQQ